MTQDISSLMDGELEGREADAALRACCGDEDRKRTWYLYHAIGAAMRGQAPATLDMPANVFEKLRAQPTVLAPRTRVRAATVTRVALAAAASVATVGVVGWLGSQGGNPEPVPVPIVATKTPEQSIQPVASTTTIVPAPAVSVQEYLVAHRQVPSPDLYRPVTNTAPAAVAR
ncbi:MAG TPA: sigma-E factor negative regulatory protein [Usitatibacter sp.]|nr:sigma-E factor negative regulatory protein [Usitatibacter sp.]